MNEVSSVRRAVLAALLSGAAMTPAAQAQDASELDEIVVTGTRITQPGVASSSPIYSVGAEEIKLQQQPEIERIIRLLPITLPSDGQNVNNGTAGAATINLRGLGSQRNLILIDGKRLTPYNYNGLVDTSMIPTALVERIDIITGGASAVYGSDAISGALNFILKKDFEGIAVDSNFSQTGNGEGATTNIALTMGSNLAEDRGNVVFSFNYVDRDPILLGAFPLGQQGIETATGAGYEEYLAGQGPIPAPAGCDGPNAVASGGSTTTLPTRVAIAGGPGLGQFRNDGSLGSNCSVFNFNPYNYYQTPQERFGGVLLGSLKLDEHAEAYARFNYGNTTVVQQVAPSGVFGTAFWTPLSNPLITAPARASIISAAEAGRLAGTVNTAAPDVFENWRDINGNGVVDAPDYLSISYRRRTVEFGPRTEEFNNENFQVLLGMKGQVAGDWQYDASFSYGESNRTNGRGGYTNVTNIANALDSTDGVTCNNGDPTCVPLNLFGGYGSITPEMAAYSSATALQQQAYQQTIVSASVTGPLAAARLPTADSPLAVSFGAEYRDEFGSLEPDECLKLAPASCLGGAGGNLLPIAGGFDVKELFGEAILPLVNGMAGAQGLDLELGYRWSDYSETGSDETWKVGLNWRPIDSLLFRVMQQRAARAPNVGELAAPQVAGLNNAQRDPCSVVNTDISAELTALCISTGMSAAQVGTVEDIVSGQVNTFQGTDLDNLPAPEQADTLTLGLVWTPDLAGTVRRTTLSVDYYEIDIEEWIGTFAAQEVLDGCYVAAQASECAKVHRVGGTLTLPGAGLDLFTTNLAYLKAEGVEVGFTVGVDLGRFGSLDFSGNVNKYLTQESRSSIATPVLQCKGYFGTSCSPLPDTRWVQRTTWNYENLQVSMLWRHLDSVTVEPAERANVYSAFQSIDAYDYVDLYASYQLWDKVQLSFGVNNVLDEDPPVVGNEAGATSFNSGNTFPSTYDTLGRVYTLGLNVHF